MAHQYTTMVLEWLNVVNNVQPCRCLTNGIQRRSNVVMLSGMPSRMEVVFSKGWCVWVALSSEFIDCTLPHHKYCGHSVIDGVLESSLRVTIDYNLLCIRVCAFYKSSMDIV